MNTSGTVTAADVIYMIGYLYNEGPAPVEQCGDIDDYELTTTRDLAWVNAYTVAGGAAPICPPANGVYTTIPNAAYLITHTRVFRAGQSVDTLHISLVSSSPTKNMTLPITILVDGALPGIGVAEVNEDDWSYANAVVAPVGAPSNSVLMGFVNIGPIVEPGVHDLGYVELTMPPAGVDREIQIALTSLPPMQSGQPVNYPMVVRPDFGTPAVAPCFLSPTCCPFEITGDVNLDSTTTASDIIYMVAYVFKGGPEPLPIAEAGDVNCDLARTSADIIYMVNYVFKSGPTPCECANTLS